MQCRTISMKLFPSFRLPPHRAVHYIAHPTSPSPLIATALHTLNTADHGPIRVYQHEAPPKKKWLPSLRLELPNYPAITDRPPKKHYRKPPTCRPPDVILTRGGSCCSIRLSAIKRTPAATPQPSKEATTEPWRFTRDIRCSCAPLLRTKQSSSFHRKEIFRACMRIAPLFISKKIVPQ